MTAYVTHAAPSSRPPRSAGNASLVEQRPKPLRLPAHLAPLVVGLSRVGRERLARLLQLGHTRTQPRHLGMESGGIGAAVRTGHARHSTPPVGAALGTLEDRLRTLGADYALLDAREVLIVRHEELGAAVDWDATRQRFDAWRRDHAQDRIVVTGYVARDEHGRDTVLGRNGSDYSGAIFAALFSAWRARPAARRRRSRCRRR